MLAPILALVEGPVAVAIRLLVALVTVPVVDPAGDVDPLGDADPVRDGDPVCGWVTVLVCPVRCLSCCVLVSVRL